MGLRKVRLIVVAFALTSASCVSHPVGPARTFGKYEGKAVTSAEGVLSAVQTARLFAKTAARGNAFGPFLANMGSESEDAASAVQGTFDSIQPPNAKSDRLRSELDELIAGAVSHLAELRIAMRRGKGADALRIARPLNADAAKLERFIDEHQS